ncbi:MAG: hypothetical protein KAR08_09475, partial [Candidatus Heimdallarchaeota archaeon]|nr:hypothetical protein [Candidatus Heimdallarchaeota archaeon]
SAKKKKRQTLQRKKVGSAAGTQKKPTTKKPVAKPAAPKPKAAPVKKPADKPKAAAADEVPTVTVDKEIVVAYKGRNYKFDKKISMKDLKEKKVPKIVKDKVAESREFKSWS